MQNTKKVIGVTGSNGFIGGHLTGFLRMNPEIEVRGASAAVFQDDNLLDNWLSNMDMVVHLAGLSRHDDGDYLYKVNCDLTAKLIAGLERKGGENAVYFASTTHIDRDLPYHRSKRQAQEMLETWAKRSGGRSVTLLMANTFGPYSRPYYNSVVSTFCYLAAIGKAPEQLNDAILELIYVGDLVREIKALLLNNEVEGAVTIPANYQIELKGLWDKLHKWRLLLPLGNQVPEDLNVAFDVDLWNTLRSYSPY